VGVVANGNVSSFTPGAGWTQVTPPATPYSGGSGAGKRTLTPAYQYVPGGGPYALTGSLTGPGFWQAAVISLAAPPSCTAGNEDFSGFNVGDKPTTFSGGTIDTPYGYLGQVWVQNAFGIWNGNFADGAHLLFSGYPGATPFRLTFNNAVSSVELDADPNDVNVVTQTLTAYDASDNVVGTDSDSGAVRDQPINHLTVSSATTDIKYFTIDTTSTDGVAFSNIVWTCS
jgi:hypothetical protein